MCDLTWSPAQAHLLTWAFPGAFVYLWELVSFLLGLLHFGDLVSLLSLPFKAGGSGLVYSDILVRLSLFESTFHITSLSKRGMIWCEEYLMVLIKAGHGHQALGSIIHGELSLVFITSTQRVGIVPETLGGLRTRL